MRDPKRITVLLRILQLGWEKAPDLQFGQLIENFKRYTGKQDLFYIEDDDMMEELADSEDEEKWYPKYKDCECCQGFVFKCQGKVCQSLGLCYCKMKDDCDD